MPSKYSHSVVLAHYSNRGLIDFPGEQRSLYPRHPATAKSVQHITQPTTPSNRSVVSQQHIHYDQLSAAAYDHSLRRRDHTRQSHLLIADSSSDGENESVRSTEPSLASVSTRVTSCSPTTPRSATMGRVSLSIDSTSSRRLERSDGNEHGKQGDETAVTPVFQRPVAVQDVKTPATIRPSQPGRAKLDHVRPIPSERGSSPRKLARRAATVDTLTSHYPKPTIDVPARDTSDPIWQQVMFSQSSPTKRTAFLQRGGIGYADIPILQPLPRRHALPKHSELHRQQSDISTKTQIYDPLPKNAEFDGILDRIESQPAFVRQPTASSPGTSALPMRDKHQHLKRPSTANVECKKTVRPAVVPPRKSSLGHRTHSFTSLSTPPAIGALSVVRKAPSRPSTRDSVKAASSAWLPSIPHTPLLRSFDPELFDTDSAPTLLYSLVGVETKSGRRKLSLQREVVLSTEEHFLLDDEGEAAFAPDVAKRKGRDGSGSPLTPMEQLLREAGPRSRLDGSDGVRASTRDGRPGSSWGRSSIRAASFREKFSFFGRLRSKSMSMGRQ